MNKDLISTFSENNSLLNECLEHTKNEYRSYDPALYLYNQLFDYSFDNKFTHSFIELLYVTLTAWGMNSRSARLSEFDIFENSILSHKEDFFSLKNKRLCDLDDSVFEILNNLFTELNLVQSKVPLVTFSKTLHFILPELVGPIDRKYTITFFDGYQHINNRNLKKQFEQFKIIHTNYKNFANSLDLSHYVNENPWNKSIPKVIDNAIIGYMKLYGDNENGN